MSLPSTIQQYNTNLHKHSQGTPIPPSLLAQSQSPSASYPPHFNLSLIFSSSPMSFVISQMGLFSPFSTFHILSFTGQVPAGRILPEEVRTFIQVATSNSILFPQSGPPLPVMKITLNLKVSSFPSTIQSIARKLSRPESHHFS
jgi:hypothetical protein